MSFDSRVIGFASRVKDMMNMLSTKETTKTSLVMPFFAMMGYDVFDALEFVPDFKVGGYLHSHEKVDYCILRNNRPFMLIEVLDLKDDMSKLESRLIKYFEVTHSKYLVVTNGVVYCFYTGDEMGKINARPLFVLNFTDIDINTVSLLSRFRCSHIDNDGLVGVVDNHAFKGVEKLNSWAKYRGSLISNGVPVRSGIQAYREAYKKHQNSYMIINNRVVNRGEKILGELVG